MDLVHRRFQYNFRLIFSFSFTMLCFLGQGIHAKSFSAGRTERWGLLEDVQILEGFFLTKCSPSDLGSSTLDDIIVHVSPWNAESNFRMKVQQKVK